jgi:hypothetical protein
MNSLTKRLNAQIETLDLVNASARYAEIERQLKAQQDVSNALRAVFEFGHSPEIFNDNRFQYAIDAVNAHGYDTIQGAINEMIRCLDAQLAIIGNQGL